MIRVSVDEAYAFDMLAILSVKCHYANGKEETDKTSRNYKRLEAEIKSGIGIDKFNHVINSEEYNDLFNINMEIFDTIDLLNKACDQVHAGYVNDLNYARYKVKTKLQAKFFPSIRQTEIKQGYFEKSS